MVDPVELGKTPFTKRARPSELARVNVYLGRPLPAHQPDAASYFDRHRGLWESEVVCEVKSRDLNYRHHVGLYETDAHIEIGAWSGPHCYPLFIRDELRAKKRRPYYHFLSEKDFSRLRRDHLF